MHYLKLLLEPVALLFFLWLWVTWRLWVGRHRPWKLSLAGVLAFWLVASPLGANSLAWLLERNHPHASVCAGFTVNDPVVVLGGGMRGSDALPTQASALMEASMVRTFAALGLWQQLGRAPMILVSGGGAGGVSEAALMAHILIQSGVPTSQIVREESSRSTRENALFSSAFLGAMHAERFYLVTSAMHMPRARLAFEAVGLPMCPWPVDHQAFMPDVGGMWIPSLRPLQKSTAALHEIKGLLWYWLSGAGSSAADAR